MRSVLIVEDDAMVRRLLARHFAKSGATILEAADADEAVAMFTEPDARFDVVITDVHLPGRTGLDLATELRLHRADQPIVFVTGDVDEALARRALEGGKAGYLLKPFEFFELDAAVAQAVQTSAAAPPPSTRPTDPADASGWYAEQRRLLAAAAQRPLDMRVMVAPVSHKKQERRGVLLKIGMVVLVLLALAWIIGYGLFPERTTPREPTYVEPAGSDNRTIYVPYEAPPSREQQRGRR